MFRSGGGGAYRPGAGITLPEVIQEVKPAYTAEAMRAKVQGTVLLECVVRPDGSVSDVEVLRSLDSAFPVASFHFEPVLTGEGEFMMDLVRVQAGRLREAFRALGCRGVTRTDLRYDDTSAASRDAIGRFVVLEVNTQPGMTPLSLVPEIAAHRGLDFEALVRWMVEDATCGR